MAAATEVVHASLATILAIVIAPVASMAVLMTKMLGRSGRVRLSLSVLRQTKADVATLIVYDAIGGAICAGAVLLLGITRPPALVSGFTTAPVLTWSIVGALGPLVSVGILDRLPLRESRDVLERDRKTRKEEEVARIFAEVRFQASQRILTLLYEEVQVRAGIERDKHSARAKELFHTGRLHFDDVAREVDLFTRAWHRRVPQEVSAILRKRQHWPTDQDPGRETLMLVETLLVTGLIRPVTIACKVAERRTTVTAVTAMA